MDRDKNAPRKRSVNFQLSEIRTLVDLVLQYKDIIENKKSDAVTWQEKKSAWAEIATKFNAASGVQLRTAENLRLKYECLKKELRKKAARKKKSIGVNVDIPEYVDYEKKLLEILTLSIQGLSSIGDSDDIEKCDVTTNPESHQVEPTVEALPSCSNNINAERQTATLKRKRTPHGLKTKKNVTLHVKKDNASVHDKFAEETELVKLQFETQKAQLQFKHNKYKLKMEILQEKLKIKKNQNELLLKQIKEQDLKNTILLKQCTQDL